MRAMRAHKALAANGTGQSTHNDAEAITDLLANIRHLCDLRGLDFAKLDRVAYSHYVEELRTEKGQ